ncbi:MAG: hypothetical protein N3A64_05285 [Desulfobacterota bacterium]|nr:hypothetical protein [Thermodesulfobacteriota bacterium]
MGKKGGRFGKYGEQKRKECFRNKPLPEVKPQLDLKPTERWRSKKTK